MGLLSATTSLTRYRVEGALEDPVLETIRAGLHKYAIADIDGEPAEETVGWTDFQHPFQPVFEGSNFAIGSAIVFALRVDKKSIPAQLIHKHVARESARRLKEQKRTFLSRDEKKALREHVMGQLSLKMPAIPKVYDIVWLYEKTELWCFSNLKSANEALETLFYKAFRLHLIRLFPYTMAHFDPALTPAMQDALAKLSHAETNT